MRVVMFKDRFAGKIEANEKTSTIRPKARCKTGDVLSLRKWSGKPYRSKHVIIKEAVCKDVLTVFLDEEKIIVNGRAFLEPWNGWIAECEGFESWEAMREFFQKTHGLPFSGELIYWGEKPFICGDDGQT
jgi:hypothetical protein